MMEKRCLVAGCLGYPCFGFGFRQPQWACADHRALLNAAPVGASQAVVDVGSLQKGKKPAAAPQAADKFAKAQGSLL